MREPSNLVSSFTICPTFAFQCTTSGLGRGLRTSTATMLSSGGRDRLPLLREDERLPLLREDERFLLRVDPLESVLSVPKASWLPRNPTATIISELLFRVLLRSMQLREKKCVFQSSFSGIFVHLHQQIGFILVRTKTEYEIVYSKDGTIILSSFFGIAMFSLLQWLLENKASSLTINNTSTTETANKELAYITPLFLIFGTDDVMQAKLVTTLYSPGYGFQSIASDDHAQSPRYSKY